MGAVSVWDIAGENKDDGTGVPRTTNWT